MHTQKRISGAAECSNQRKWLTGFSGLAVILTCFLLLFCTGLCTGEEGTTESGGISEEQPPVTPDEPAQTMPSEENKAPQVAETSVSDPAEEDTDDPGNEEIPESPIEIKAAESAEGASESTPETPENEDPLDTETLVPVPSEEETGAQASEKEPESRIGTPTADSGEGIRELSPEGSEIESPVLTLGLVKVESGAITLSHGAGTGYTFDGDYSGGKIIISEPGSYLLGNDLISSDTYAIQITATTGTVTLDGGGYSITRGTTGAGSYGVYLSGTPTTTTIQNFDGSAGTAHSGISGFSIAGIATSAAGTRIENNKVNSNTDGIRSTGDGTTITGNTVDGNSGSGIVVQTGTSFSIHGNTIKNSGTAGLTTTSGTGQVFNPSLPL